MKAFRTILYVTAVFIVTALFLFKSEKITPEEKVIEKTFTKPSRAGLDNSKNPYALFGDTANLLMTPEEQTGEQFLRIQNQSQENSLYSYVLLDMKSGKIFLVKIDNTILREIKLDPTTITRFLSTDPASAEYPSIGPYAFVMNNPINAVDPDGRKVLFVNGYYNNGGSGDSPFPDAYTGTQGGRNYWSESFIQGAGSFFHDQNYQFIDGRGDYGSSADDRFKSGYAWAQANYSTLTEGVVDANGVQTETIKVVSHSMGAAYSEGVIAFLSEQGLTVETAVHFSAADAGDIITDPDINTYQITYENDAVLKFINGGAQLITGIDAAGIVETPGGLKSDAMTNHGITKWDPSVFDALEDLQNIQFKQTDYNVDWSSNNIVIPDVRATYSASGNSNGTQFNKVIKNGNTYKGTSETNTYTKN